MSYFPPADIENDLSKLGPSIMEEYRKVVSVISSIFTDDEFRIWAKEGLSIASHTVRSWEATVEYFRVSPDVAKILEFPSFMQWARSGNSLAQESSTLAIAFFRASPNVVEAGSLRAQSRQV